MTIDDVTLENVKKYLRIEPDNNEEDNLLRDLIVAAKTYVAGITGKVYNPDNEVWNLVVKMLACHWYENRGAEVTGTITSKIAHTVDALVNHIALCGDYPCSGQATSTGV